MPSTTATVAASAASAASMASMASTASTVASTSTAATVFRISSGYATERVRHPHRRCRQQAADGQRQQAFFKH